jgi:hypothetical protein
MIFEWILLLEIQKNWVWKENSVHIVNLEIFN